MTCECSEIRMVPYGETWQCDSCGRRWTTNQIPADVYWGIMHEMRRYRLVVIGTLALGPGFGLLAFLVAERLILLLPIVLASGSSGSCPGGGARSETRAQPPELAVDPE